jgi:hypothetical protein
MGFQYRSLCRLDESSTKHLGSHVVQESHVVLPRGENLHTNECEIIKFAIFRLTKQAAMVVGGLMSFPFHTFPQTFPAILVNLSKLPSLKS